MSLFMHRFLVIALGLLGLLMLFALLYAVLGKRFTDNIVAANMIAELSNGDCSLPLCAEPGFG